MRIAVHKASDHDTVGARLVLDGLKERYPRLQKVLADGAYQGALQTWFHRHTKGCLLSIVKRTELKTFVVLPQRWIVERTFAWLNRNRRLSKDFETDIKSSTTWLFLASIQLIMRKLAEKHL